MKVSWRHVAFVAERDRSLEALQTMIAEVTDSKPVPMLWQRPWWTKPAALAVAWLLPVIYGSLLPFDFDLAAAVDQHGGVLSALFAILTSPRWVWVGNTSPHGVPQLTADLLLNLALYIPLGVLFRLAMPRGLGWTLVTVALVAATSWALESVQSLSPHRVSSMVDVLTNTLPATAAAIAAPLLSRFARQVTFFAYVRLAGPFAAIIRFIRLRRTHPRMMLLLVALGCVLLLAWYAWTVPRLAGSPPAFDWLPFYKHFVVSYDTGAAVLARSVIVYCLVVALLCISFLNRQHRAGLRWILLTVALLAFALECWRSFGAGKLPDTTEPILALIAAGLVFVNLFSAIYAVRCSCRRREGVPVANDRRRRPHDYRFSLSRS
ncbi:MAG: VanZ family protein [Rhodospirillales bacterium]|nr:VanZ family protein [Rhodospirillales bacterium]